MNGMDWGGNIPEFSRAPGRMENSPTVKERAMNERENLVLSAAIRLAEIRMIPPGPA